MEEIIISVIIPIYNESKYIDRCLSSLCQQTYPKSKIEYLIVDGKSTDDTVDKVRKFSSELNIRVLENEKRLVTYGVNIGIENAVGQYIVRMDAHAVYCKEYIEKCIFYLENTDADNVGGIAETYGEGHMGEVNADILSSKFGVGNSKFRTSAESGYVDTVPFGAFRREIFEEIGMFNPQLPRSEDNDFNSRIRAKGGKVYLASDIRFTYFCRDTVGGLLSQAIKNGDSLFLTLRHNPKAMSIRHFIPFVFCVSLIFLPVLSLFEIWALKLFAVELGAYFVLDAYFSFFTGRSKKRWIKFFLYPMFHVTYGIGSAIGALGIRLY